MPIIFYSPEARMAVSDDPLFPAEEPVAEAGEGGPGYPIIQEWQTYFVKFYGDSVPGYFPEPEAGLFTRRRFPAQLYEICFRNAVGLTCIGPVSLRVANTKIGEASYEALLSYVADQFSNLVFSFGPPLGQSYHKEKVGRDIGYLEYLFLKRYLLDASPNLDAISAMISANPHHRLYRQLRDCSIDSVSSTEPEMLIRLVAGGDRLARLHPGHPLVATSLGRAITGKTGRNLYPTGSAQEKKYLTVDTNENRFVKHFLETIPRRLKGLRDLLSDSKTGYLNPEILLHLEIMDKKIASFLADPMWNDVGKMAFIPVASQVLQRREGYRQLFRLFSLSQLASRCDFISKDDFKNLVETKDTPTLFEYWSFFIIKEIMDELLKQESRSRILSGNELEHSLSEGLCIRYEGGIRLWFNKTYPGSRGHLGVDALTDSEVSSRSYSHAFRPDIVIVRSDVVLIFDAKYKGERGGFYCEDGEGAIFSWKDEDIDKMHCYREAIFGVTGAFILYPGEEMMVYPAHGANDIFEGVGALPLKPVAGARPVQKHLDDIKRIVTGFVGEA